ncbi:MAG TPA: hypothetical protein VMF90_26075 [Rhizobiaceae bacterium]|nr:hypothetical protein [Rhizobiaceae bacterium]
MPIYSTVTRYASNWRAYRDEMRTRQLLDALPVEVLKDIGYPDTPKPRSRSELGIGSWVGGR